MLSFAILTSSRLCIKTFTKGIIHFCSSQNRHIDILNSQFHMHGVKHFQKSRIMNRQSTTTIFQIDKLITQLQKQRIRMKELKETQHIKNDEELITHSQSGKYLDIYHKMRERVEDLKINEEWGYRIVGWYNIQSTLNTLIEELLDKGNKVEQNSLIEAINWMKPHQLIINTEESVQELIKQKNKIDNFYKQLAVGHSLQTLRKIQSIFQDVNTNSKGKYYHSYLTANIHTILQNALKSEQSLKNTLWLIEMYVITFNDDPKIIQKIQQFFLNSKLLEKREVVATFIKIYNHMGRANQQIYHSYIQQHIKKAPANIIQIQLLYLQFLIHSEAQDEQTLNLILKNIAKISKNQAMSSGHKLHVHYLLHYLKIKDLNFTFPFQMFRQYSEICRNFQEDGTFAKSIAVQLDQKSRRQGKQYYNSSCVLKKKELQQKDKRKKQGTPIQKAEGFKKFKDVKFCCLNIDFCVYDQTNKKGIILEKNYHRFTQSGRLIRMEQIKAQILRHYGLEINYMQKRSQLQRKLGK